MSGNAVKGGLLDTAVDGTWLIPLPLTFVYEKTLPAKLRRRSRKHLLSPQTRNETGYPDPGEDTQFSNLKALCTFKGQQTFC